MTSLDVDALRALVLLDELASFTRAAQALGTTQSAISLRLKRLEDRLGRRLVERTPRLVRLTAAGITLAAKARRVVEAHDAALAAMEGEPLRRLRLGVSDHAGGAKLPQILSRLAERMPDLTLEVRVGLSQHLDPPFEAGELDAAVVRSDGTRRGGEVVMKDPLVWYAAPHLRWRRGQPVPLLMLAEPCVVRQATIRALDKAKVPWVEAYRATGVAAILAAATAGLGVAPLGRHLKPDGLEILGERHGLPTLPDGAIVLRSRVTDARLAQALKEVSLALKAA